MESMEGDFGDFTDKNTPPKPAEISLADTEPPNPAQKHLQTESLILQSFIFLVIERLPLIIELT